MSLIKKMFTPLPILLYDAFTDEGTDSPAEVVKEEELERVQELIEKGREQGLSELEIEISHDFAVGCKVEGGVTIDSVPANVTMDISKKRNGKYIMKVKYLPKTYTDDLRDLKKLVDDGVLTEEEFTQAKIKILSKNF